MAALFLLLLPQLIKGQCYTLICNQNVPLPLGNDCTGSVNPHFIIQNNWSCQGPMTMQYFDSNNAPVGPTVTSNYLGQTLSVHVKHNWTGLECWGSVVVTDNKKPVIEAANVSIHCTQDPGTASVGEPLVTDNCSSTLVVSHQDSVIDFGCGYTGFEGYFAPSNWTVCLPNTGDGGVDVTGAPNSVLVEGASNSPLSLAPRYVTQFKIVIPTEGYVSFDWSSFGGSNFNTDAFYLTINNWCVQLSDDTTHSGSYTTGVLHPGDVLSFEQTSDGNADLVNTLISNFHFHTLAWRVIHRKWSATDEWGNTGVKTQVIAQKRAHLSQVVFPPSHNGTDAPMLPCGSSASLSVTGSPFVDEDGDLNTTHDQYPVQHGDCVFDLQYEDQSTTTCEGSELILRKWTITDACSGQSIEHIQWIQLFDTAPPVLVCPPPTVLSTDHTGCHGNIVLPDAAATDDCTASITVMPSWDFGLGYGPFANIQQGTYAVTYHAEDACGNAAECQTTVIVQDEVPPTVICDGQTVAALTELGAAEVHAISVDNGSYDWCCVESFEIKRSDAPDNEYGPTVLVTCDDLTQQVMVRLKVTDCSGNYNYCDVELIVQDNHPPLITAPADLTVGCDTPPADLTQFGQPVISDNCQFFLIENVDQTFAGCGEGTITRTWVVSDSGGNTATAQQTIHFVGNGPCDTQPPTAQCLGGLTVNLGLGGQANLPASAFNAGSTDNCTPAHELVFCYSPDPADVFRIFDCGDVAQLIPVQLYVMDLSGNMGFCQTFLMVQDNQAACDTGQLLVNISGVVRTPAGAPVSWVTVALEGSASATATTGPDGVFLFENLPAGGNFTITPTKDTYPLNGVTAYDLLLINGHILGSVPFQHAWQHIAADANSSGTVTAYDLVAIQSVILQNATGFPNGTPSWRFVPAGHVFPNPNAPFPFPQTLSLQNLTADYQDAHFTAIKIGDVNGNAQPGQ